MSQLRRPGHRVLSNVFRGVALALALVATAGAQQVKEYELKAAMLLNITRYVTWPGTAFSGPDAPFVVGVVGEDPFGEVLDKTLTGQNVSGRRIVVRRYSWGQRFEEAHLLFIAKAESGNVPKLVTTIGRRPVVTVGDSNAFAARGGVIGFRTRSSRIEMDVNLQAAKTANIAVSSKLLMLAKSVIDGKGGR